LVWDYIPSSRGFNPGPGLRPITPLARETLRTNYKYVKPLVPSEGHAMTNLDLLRKHDRRIRNISWNHSHNADNAIVDVASKHNLAIILRL
jgi:hypothetical protein